MIVAIGMYAFARFYAFDQPVTDSVKNLLSLLSPVAFGMAFYSIGVLELQVKSGTRLFDFLHLFDESIQNKIQVMRGFF